MSLMVAENASGGGALAVKGQHVIASHRAITEDENLVPTFGTQVDEVTLRACANSASSAAASRAIGSSWR
jgi:hypothetical protein